MTSRSRYRIAQAAHLVVSWLIPCALVGDVAALVPRIPDRVLEPVHWLAGDRYVLVAAGTIAVLFVWEAFAAPGLRRRIERRYVAGLPLAEWLEHLGLTAAWKRPAPTLAEFDAAHGDRSRWDAADFEAHQNLCLHQPQLPLAISAGRRLALPPATQHQEHHAG
ncbi:hypothetical protein [Streptomyces klenkii]